MLLTNCRNVVCVMLLGYPTLIKRFSRSNEMSLIEY
ncbi:hypothetical protein XF_2168 [Xylella fastidiosa 9a5c]|uniref:Uncharacterized protein n=1 Tax=Xylella fastidiosa (strain 9a5c) TaxID=160492 RepID=Q9PBH6_XYLFA|nr:hypothetical protein XF_2168 [Xylella fastidiosa 9a5c]